MLQTAYDNITLDYEFTYLRNSNFAVVPVTNHKHRIQYWL